MGFMDDFQRDVALIKSVDAIPTILDVVCQTTGMGFAAIARVTEDRWIACNVRDDINFSIKPGEELKVETTICHEIHKTHKPVIIDNLAEDPIFHKHPTPTLYGIQSYISVPIILPGNRFFGTLCAIDPNPAHVNTPEVIGMFNLFAELIAFHIDASQKVTKSESNLLEEQENSGMREQFIAVLGHDLRNPLNAITSGAEVLKYCGVNERGKEVIEMMQGCVVRMNDMIGSVLDFTRVRMGGGMELNCNDNEPIEATLRHVISETQTTFPSREIEIDISLSKNINCDRSRIAQLLSNLLGNAMTYGKVDKAVKISASNTDDSFELSVSNATDPIPSEKLENMFQPFERGDTSQHQDGLGLGLYIASEIASAHGGNLSVNYEKEIITFTFSMPIQC